MNNALAVHLKLYSMKSVTSLRTSTHAGVRYCCVYYLRTCVSGIHLGLQGSARKITPKKSLQLIKQIAKHTVGACTACVCVVCELVLTIFNAEETTQLRRKATRKEGPLTEPRTRARSSIAELQPHEPRNRPCSFVLVAPHVPVTGVPNPWLVKAWHILW